jgi:hypothetical protein
VLLPRPWPEEFAVALKGAFSALSQMRTYWHNWTDRNGVSHMTQCEMREFKLQSISKPADPQWQDRQSPSGATIIITVQPPHWNGTCHENPTVRTWARSLRLAGREQRVAVGRAMRGAPDPAHRCGQTV